MEPKEYIAALDLGSSKIIGMVGFKKQDAKLEVIAIEKVDSLTCIRRGTIHNLEETLLNAKQIINKLNNRIHPNKLTKVYVGVGGQSIHTVNHKAYRDLEQEEFVNDDLIRSLIDECLEITPNNAEVLEVIPNEYKLDSKKTEINPVGVACTEIEGNFKLIVGRPSSKQIITRAIEEKSEIKVAELPISQMAAASLLLSDADKVLGCALIDFGAGTTSVSIYKDGLLRHLAVIPFGGNVVTKDICSANLMEAEAEKLKKSFGSAILNPESDNKVFHPRGTGALDDPKIDLHTLNNIIEGRMSEIIENVWSQIEISGISKQLGAGIYYTGGASQLRNVSDLIKRITGIEAKKAVNCREIINASASNEAMQNPAYSVVLGLLASGTMNCVKIAQQTITNAIPEPIFVEMAVQEIEKPIEKPSAPDKDKGKGIGGWKKKFVDKSNTLFGSMFENNDDTEMK
jgi:cell division protein FtsA